ncbi:hypothetical protein [Brevundimonas sp. FT23028]|uniref:hypothetical protein n=1 Tax=Brevundimonas sp. FT23028 TaxID=3393748 RepID=UPI003B58897E
MRPIARLAPALLLSTTLVLGACASTPGNVGPTPSWIDASAGQFEGWARVRNGEIQLFAEQRDLTRGLPADCVSAALPRNAQRAAGDLNGMKVRLHGRTAAWADRDGAQTYDWQGSNIVNDCRREVVILADRAEALR